MCVSDDTCLCLYVYLLEGVCGGGSAVVCFMWSVCVCMWVCVFVCIRASSPHRPSLCSSFQGDAGQLRATGHHLSPAAASSSTIGRRQTALPMLSSLINRQRCSRAGLTILEAMQQMRLDLQTHQLLSQDQEDVQERHGQLRATDHHLRPAAASSRHIVRRQTALPYAVVIDQVAKLFERLQSTFVFSSCAKMRVDL